LLFHIRFRARPASAHPSDIEQRWCWEDSAEEIWRGWREVPTPCTTDLATIEDLKLAGLQPSDGQPIAALFKLRTGDREHLCGL
jgi:hypothetical protein